ncbi:metalloregulator ArsR/SmtB family transcription factor [Micromonospora yasonensis]|uniref:ArsR/SmtB family transcription factor n=1 Tax=Micromonospora yasonensis TaxID=1128667 RepID=UPI00222E1536|nr:metalloregulator ArsR/SmtB family transcription factor [Micromonospora yasonensis]MCW3840615.1 metalloregulator ArsR/SmtB family transcription factor [Micromonospora yasonensis]
MVTALALMYAPDNATHLPDVGREPPSPRQVETVVIALRMLADPTRLRILWHLAGAEYDVASLTAELGASRPAVSQHLGKLRLAGLVTVRRDGRRAVYSARGGHVRRMVAEVLWAADHQLTGAADHE